MTSQNQEVEATGYSPSPQRQRSSSAHGSLPRFSTSGWQCPTQPRSLTGVLPVGSLYMCVEDATAPAERA